MKLYNADCLRIMQEMPDKSVDLVITDPPYGIGRKDDWDEWLSGFKRNGKKRINSSWSNIKTKEYFRGTWDETRIDKKYITEIIRISKNQIIWGGNYITDFLPPSASWIVWDKKVSYPNLSKCELAWCSIGSHIEIFRYLWSGYRKEEPEDRIHPTQKPIKLFEWIIKNYAKEGDLICDPFFGSGSCLVAAVRLGHPIIGMEKERVYFEAGKAQIEDALRQEKLSTQLW